MITGVTASLIAHITKSRTVPPISEPPCPRYQALLAWLPVWVVPSSSHHGGVLAALLWRWTCTERRTTQRPKLFLPLVTLVNKISMRCDDGKMPTSTLVVERQIPLVVIADPPKPEIPRGAVDGRLTSGLGHA